jgi:hypothetical protein
MSHLFQIKHEMAHTDYTGTGWKFAGWCRPRAPGAIDRLRKHWNTGSNNGRKHGAVGTQPYHQKYLTMRIFTILGSEQTVRIGKPWSVPYYTDVTGAKRIMVASVPQNNLTLTRLARKFNSSTAPLIFARAGSY